MKRVFLVNPALSKLGYSIITPRWLFVIARATPTDLVGDPILNDYRSVIRDEPGFSPQLSSGAGDYSHNLLDTIS